MRREFYLDNAATTPLHPEAFAAMSRYYTWDYGNPSTPYSLGLRARQAVEEAREAVADLIHGDPDGVIFTSGGTEADNMAIHYAMGKVNVTTLIEHEALLKTFEHYARRANAVVEKLLPEIDGAISSDIQFADCVRFVSVMAVNNETGVIQPVDKLAAAAFNVGAVFHTDAVQAVGHIPVDVSKYEDKLFMLSASAHKFNGPKGVGFLYVSRAFRDEMSPLLFGGGQENGLRSGTENVAGIVGMGVAARKAAEAISGWGASGIRDTKSRFIELIFESIPGLKINGNIEKTVPGTVNLLMPYCSSSIWQELLDEYGIYVGTGSACSSYENKPSHVLKAMGLTDDECRRSLRFSFGDIYEECEIQYLVRQITEVAGVIQKYVEA